MFDDRDQRKWYLRSLCYFWLVVCACLWPGLRAEASGARVAIETESATVVKGDYFYIVVTITSSDPIGGFEGYFSYDQHVMRYITGGNVSSGNDDVFTISDTERESAVTKIKYSIRFLARKTGNCTVELEKPYGVYDEDGVKMSVASDSLNIRVISKKKAEKLKLLPGNGDLAGESEDGSVAGDRQGEADDAEMGEEEAAAGDVDISSVRQSPEGTGAGLMDGMPEGEEQPPQEAIDVTELEDDPEVPEEQTEVPSVKKISGPGRTTCIVVIVLACLGLAGIIIYAVWSGRERYDVEIEGFDDNEEWDIENKIYFADPVPPEDAEEENHQKPEESLEEIERRLEQKRQWLRKGN